MTYSEPIMDPIRVLYERDEDTWVATSPDLAGWTAIADTYEKCRRLAEEGARFYLESDDVVVEHYVPPGSLAAQSAA